MAKTKEKQPSRNEDDLVAELLLKEADESLRQDRFDAFWREWGSTVIGMALMVILGTIVGVGWQKWQSFNRISQTNNLVQFTTNTSDEVVLKGPYKGIANMMRAAELTMNGEVQDSTVITQLLEEAADSDMPSQWTYLAEWGSLRSRSDVATTADIKIGVADDMITLAERDDNPFSPAIMMEAAVIKGENNQYNEAVSILERVSNDKRVAAIPSLQDRIDAYLQLYKTELAQALTE